MSSYRFRINHANSVLIIGAALYFAYLGYAIDKAFWADEGYMLQATRNAEIYKVMVIPSLFAHVLKPLFYAAGYNIVIYRILGIIVMAICSVLFSRSFVYAIDKEMGGRNKGLTHTNASYYIALSGSFVYSYFNGLTPSYGWLNIVGLLLLWTGLLWVGYGLPFRGKFLNRVDGVAAKAFIVSFGLFLSLAAKPTTGLFSFLMIFLWLRATVPQKTVYIYLISFGVIIFFECLSLLYWSDLTEIYRVLSRGMAVNRLTAHSLSIVLVNPLKQIYRFPLYLIPESIISGIRIRTIWIAFSIIGILLFVLRKTVFKDKRSDIFFKLASIVLLGESIYLLFSLFSPEWGIVEGGWRIQLPWITLAASIFSYNYSIESKVRTPVSRRTIIILVFLLLTPFFFAVGTNLRIFEVASQAFIFVAAAVYGIYILYLDRPRIPVYLVSAALMATILCSGWMRYFTKWPVDMVNAVHKIQVGWGGGYVKVDDKDYNYFSRLRELAYGNGFAEGDTLLDLTGEHLKTTEVIYVLGGLSLGMPAFFFDNREIIRYAMSFTPRHMLEHAWIIKVKGGNDEKEMLRPYGISFPEDYLFLGNIAKKGGVKGAQLQELWKPTVCAAGAL